MQTRLAAAGLLLVVLAFGTAACSALDRGPGQSAPETPALPRPGEGEFSVMTFNLHQYRLSDPGESAEGLVPQPRPGVEGLFRVIQQVSPDILAVQEMGDPPAWADFKHRLRQHGLEYRYEDYQRQDPDDLNLAVLSRYPIVGRHPRTNDIYTIGPFKNPVRRGFIELEIEINPAYRFRLMTAHLKSKLFHEYGQAEMRRNEARLLGNHVRSALHANPHVNLLVVGDFNDVPGSRPLREVLTYQNESILFDLRPTDDAGDAWTQRVESDTHHRVDYMLVNAGMLREVVLDKTYAVRSPLLLNASDHRPLVATFVAQERPADAAPDLSTREPPLFPTND